MDNPYIPYQKSDHFPHLSKEQRAMQFAPFAVLEGLDETIQQTQEQCETEEIEIAYEESL